MNSSRNNKTAGKGSGSNLLVTVLAVGLIIVFTFMVTDSLKQQRVQANLKGQIEAKRQELASRAAPPEGLQLQLEEAQKANQAARSAIDPDSTEVVAAILETASECSLQSEGLTTDKWSTKSAGTSIYRVLPIRLNLKGTPADLKSFIEQLEDSPAFASLVVEKFSMDNPLPSAEPTSVSSELVAAIVTREKPATGEH